MVTTTNPSAGKARRKSGAAPAPSLDSADVLLVTAQQLFAEKGIDAVSMREIARESGQRNNSALHYHFGSKEALIQAILQRGMVKIDGLRNDYLDRVFVEQRHTDLRALVEAIVWPLATGLATTQVNSYNRFLAAAQMHPEVDLAGSTREDGERGFRRIQDMLEPLLPAVPPLLLRQRFLAAVAFVIFSLADFERLKTRRGKNNRGFDLQRAVENLIDMLCGAISAPVSPQVAQRVAEHDPPKPFSARAKATP
ncbi:TetR/AcrR family transcriptional regulator [Variovorax sp. dw_308]|uniref:TetR/AcrR family transcriptional regulator n=1 Tax=Variovorax sp. dw_308 TaxID=2721546 RepID=UPI001C454805|nr:TetR/AcrR family transcriptional regulator [Variovorax sp. dw_308]